MFLQEKKSPVRRQPKICRTSRYRIAVIIPKFGLVGGGEGFAAEVTERLAADPRYEIHVFANRWRSGSSQITFHKVPIISFPRFLTTASFAYFAGRLIGKMDFDLIHSHDRVFRADLFTMHGIPHRLWVNEVRGKSWLSLFDRVTCWVEKKMVASGGCRLFMPVSRLAGEWFAREFAVLPQQMEVMSPGVALEGFPQDERRAVARLAVRQRFSLAAEVPLVLFVSMNFELKGLAQLLQAMAMLSQEKDVPPCRLLVIGKGNQGKFQKMADSLGIGAEVIFTGIVADGIEEYFLAADAFVILSGFDTFGMVVLEAMAASVPVIVSDRVGAKDLVQEGVNGFVVDREDVGTVKERLRYLLKPGQRDVLGSAARLEAEKHTWDQAAAKLAAIYQSLLKNKADSPAHKIDGMDGDNHG